jgi:hypothetical protein
MMWSRAMILAVTLAVLTSAPAWAQNAGTADAEKKASPAGDAEKNASEAADAAAQEDDPDLDPNPAQPDFTLVNLPTTLRVPRHKSAFRVTHRFARSLGSGDFGSLLEDFFGLDSGALIGLEYRFGLFRGTQVGIHRTSDRTIEFFGQQDLLPQNETRRFGLALLATIDGTNNFRDSRTPAIGAIVSHQFGDNGAVYLIPMYVGNSNLFEDQLVDDNDTVLLGFGARLRIRPTVYLIGEYSPRVAGYDPRINLGSIAVEKRLGGHIFQLNFSNGFATTMGQIARGGTGDNDWFIGFNISRKFF